MITMETPGLDSVLAAISKDFERLGLRGGTLEAKWTFGGPAADYAVIVHENLEAHHPVGEAEYVKREILEREPHFTSDLASRQAEGVPTAMAVQEIGEIYLGGMKGRTPVKTGALRESGVFTLEIR